MKFSGFLSSVALLLFSGHLFAETGSVPADTRKGAISGEGSGDMEQRLRQHQDHLLKLHEMMHQIMNARDDAERERLKEEQRKLMRDNMRLHHQQTRGHRGSERQGQGALDGTQP